jgi:deoxyribonuclease-4
MFGSHLSIAGSMLNALDEAERLSLDTVQVFTKNQQQWAAKPLDPGIVRDWNARIQAMGWQTRTVSHASYLINLASPDDVLWKKSIDLMTDEIGRCEALGIPFLVHHPGAFTTSSREEGLKRIALAYKELFTRTKGFKTVSCLENTVGSGSNLGSAFTELADLRDRIIESTGQPGRIGFCIDTCHAHAAGYDLSTTAGAKQAIGQLESDCGLSWVKVIHLNDSKAPAGSRRDLHQHIGQGTIGLPGFEVFVTHPAFADTPKIMETPKGDDPAGVPLDTLNLRRLWSMVGRGPINQPVSVPGGPSVPKTGARPVKKSSRASAKGKPATKGQPPARTASAPRAGKRTAR